MDLARIPFSISRLLELYRSGTISVATVLEEAWRRASNTAFPNVWITLLERERILSYAEKLTADRLDNLPLFGIPFAIKDNIDLAEIPTTCGCPEFGFIPKQSAFIVDRLIAAGAVPIGKTNLDQFATGLVGVRSPYGACQSVFDSRYISGGSSSGSAVAVSAGMVAFALGTDTAGSGRVPAAFNHIVGLKPTRGLLSTRGVFPACRSLDCASIFAGSSFDAAAVLNVVAAPDEQDPYSRTSASLVFPASFRFGVPKPEQLEFFDDEEASELFDAACERLTAIGGRRVEIDFSPFSNAAELLYSGAWVAERRWAVGDFFEKHRDKMDPTVRTIIGGAAHFDAISTFDGFYRLQTFTAAAEREWAQMDLLLVPTTGTTYTIDQVKADPIRLNTNLGYYTNFVNLLDLSGVAIPAGFRPSNGLPFGVTLLGRAFSESSLLELADRMHRRLGGEIGVTSHRIEEEPVFEAQRSEVLLAVVGAHLQGQPLNHQLTSRGSELVATTRTAPNYRLFALANTVPAKPGLVRISEPAGEGIEVEIWKLSHEAFGSFVNEVPAPMVIGTVTLANGKNVKGFLCEPAALDAATDITRFGGWRAFLKTQL